VEKQDVSSYNIIMIIKPEIRSETRWNQTRQSIQWIYSWYLILLLLLVLPRCL